jgi:hypothetical protein
MPTRQLCAAIIWHGSGFFGRIGLTWPERPRHASLLSATLPSLDSTKEVTSNVHDVRSEFLEPPQPLEEKNGSDDDRDRDDKLAPVHFIGKLVSTAETVRDGRNKRGYYIKLLP